MTYDEARGKVHEAIGALLADDEFAMTWVLAIDVAGSDGRRYLAHRAGGGADGSEAPTVWMALGMLTAAVDVVREQLRDGTQDDESEDDE